MLKQLNTLLFSFLLISKSAFCDPNTNPLQAKMNKIYSNNQYLEIMKTSIDKDWKSLENDFQREAFLIMLKDELSYFSVSSTDLSKENLSKLINFARLFSNEYQVELFKRSEKIREQLRLQTMGQNDLKTKYLGLNLRYRFVQIKSKKDSLQLEINYDYQFFDDSYKLNVLDHIEKLVIADSVAIILHPFIKGLYNQGEADYVNQLLTKIAPETFTFLQSDLEKTLASFFKYALALQNDIQKGILIENAARVLSSFKGEPNERVLTFFEKMNSINTKEQAVRLQKSFDEYFIEGEVQKKLLSDLKTKKVDSSLLDIYIPYVKQITNKFSAKVFEEFISLALRNQMTFQEKDFEKYFDFLMEIKNPKQRAIYFSLFDRINSEIIKEKTSKEFNQFKNRLFNQVDHLTNVDKFLDDNYRFHFPSKRKANAYRQVSKLIAFNNYHPVLMEEMDRTVSDEQAEYLSAAIKKSADLRPAIYEISQGMQNLRKFISILVQADTELQQKLMLKSIPFLNYLISNKSAEPLEDIFIGFISKVQTHNQFLSLFTIIDVFNLLQEELLNVDLTNISLPTFEALVPYMNKESFQSFKYLYNKIIKDEGKEKLIDYKDLFKFTLIIDDHKLLDQLFETRDEVLVIEKDKLPSTRINRIKYPYGFEFLEKFRTGSNKPPFKKNCSILLGKMIKRLIKKQ